MICCRLDPDCSNTHLGWQNISTKVKSFTIARVEATEIQALPLFVYNEYAHLAQHNVPAVPFSFPHPTLSPHVSGTEETFLLHSLNPWGSS